VDKSRLWMATGTMSLRTGFSHSPHVATYVRRRQSGLTQFSDRRGGVKELPDLDALVLVQPEGVGFSDVEGGVELREVPNDLVAAELRRRMWVGRQPL
jgi:hypothetical protein